MNIDIRKSYVIEFTEEDAEEFLEMMDDCHDNRPPNMTLLYKIEDFLREHK